MCAEQQAFRPSGGAPRAGSDRAGDAALGRSLALVRFLRARCQWDAKQTPETLRPYLLEEAHEVAEAIRKGDEDELLRELGDLLLNVAFQIVLAEERGAFEADAVVSVLERKMRERHPHVYGEGTEPREWEALKAQERRGRTQDPFAGVPNALEALSRAARFQERAAALNFDWPEASGALEKLREETEELERLLAAAAGATDPPDGSHAESSRETLEEVGDLLFTAVNVARLAGVHPSVALERATDKFARRFRRVVELARESGIDPAETSLETLDALWERTKMEDGT
ncbi:MAG: nucleoside triphosphate pyrophosphohydrolase [Gemmatimonadota bacterium]